MEAYTREPLTYHMLIDDSEDGSRKRLDAVIAEIEVALGYDKMSAEKYVSSLVENPKASLKIARSEDGTPLYDAQ